MKGIPTAGLRHGNTTGHRETICPRYVTPGRFFIAADWFNLKLALQSLPNWGCLHERSVGSETTAFPRKGSGCGGFPILRLKSAVVWKTAAPSV